MFGIFRKKKEDHIRIDEASMDMTGFLIDKGFTPTEARNEAIKFWQNHYKKLRSVY
jgi:hypothetical protein